MRKGVKFTQNGTRRVVSAANRRQTKTPTHIHYYPGGYYGGINFPGGYYDVIFWTCIASGTVDVNDNGQPIGGGSDAYGSGSDTGYSATETSTGYASETSSGSTGYAAPEPPSAPSWGGGDTAGNTGYDG